MSQKDDSLPKERPCEAHEADSKMKGCAMKTKLTPSLTVCEPSAEDVREYAYHLYVQSGCVPGRDQDNWLEAEACLREGITKGESHKRLHRHTHRKMETSTTVPSPEAKNLAA
jgi:hypothetical protein